MASVSDAAASTPFLLDRYRVEGQLGSGGLGTVFRATETGTGRVVALKTLDAASERATALFEREYHVLASLKHPSVVEVYDFRITEDGKRFYTMGNRDAPSTSRGAEVHR